MISCMAASTFEVSGTDVLVHMASSESLADSCAVPMLAILSSRMMIMLVVHFKGEGVLSGCLVMLLIYGLLWLLLQRYQISYC